MTTHHGRRLVVGTGFATAITLALFAGMAPRAARADAGEFVVRNQVFDGKQVIGGSTTIFAGGKAFDFLDEADEAVMFEPVAGRITLIDTKRRVRSELSLEQLADFIERMRDRALRGGSDFARFVAQPEFGERLDAETNELVLSSPLLEYRASTTAPRNAEALRNYQTFIHWQAQLNCVVNAGATPPQARMKLNDALAARQLLPERVTMKRPANIPGGGKTLRAEHSYTWRLEDAERRRVADLEQRFATFRVVPIGEYLTPPGDR
jgi:hypothetical protein